jgi:hypothetical protein
MILRGTGRPFEARVSACITNCEHAGWKKADQGARRRILRIVGG